jgi:hypothetical protein
MCFSADGISMGFVVIPDRVSAGNVLDVAVNVGEEDELVLDVQKAAVHHLNNVFDWIRI